MRCSQIFAVGLATAVCLIPSAPTSAAEAGAPASAAKAPSLGCVPTASPDPFLPDPFKFKLAGDFPSGLLPIDGKVSDSIMLSGLPCQEHVNPNAGEEDEGLENLQRSFDFYSWRTFLALNAPTDGTRVDHAKARMPARWEDMANFKPLLDVMLPPALQPPNWPADKAGIEAERERLIPEQCQVLHKQMPERMVVKMIEESFNEPFKTGPLIDQHGHYAIFDILMNRQMFDYIKANGLYSKAGQRAAVDLFVDFPPGNDHPPGDNPSPTLGAFMLKVSWKILVPSEIEAGNFHTVDALVLMPPGDPKVKRPCLPETLGLIGYHAVHKTAGRPQWIWTSFEHVKNVPDNDEVTAKTFDGPYSFFSTSCTNCPVVNATPPRPWDPDPALHLKFRKDDSFKSQIVRETPLTHATRNMNRIFHSMLQDSVWKHYMLINTQWPSTFSCTSLHSLSFQAADPATDFLKQPDMTCSPAPTFMANSTLETYSQGEVPLASSSCIACHGNAVSFQRRPSNPKPGALHLNQSDFTFMLEKAQ
ncbi:hypothetical protein UP10_02225 [Bradyrhizobium sp. LTSPM299]|uniref:hypothetical protein n=1 Tax=Bradyrhizobium sp. LTSPM299 TaxID=1619233 RepID=UPI0005E7500D|nr:hypothetical protein [Bradyrhizobium sp. LTSPM299]KJC62199.1 hypothetical protein UP10_02225 [Bradyrhizobium sp. LTSPM299]